MTAHEYYQLVGHDFPKGFQDHLTKLPKHRRNNKGKVDPLTHPYATRKCVDYWEDMEADTTTENKVKAAKSRKKGKAV